MFSKVKAFCGRHRRAVLLCALVVKIVDSGLFGLLGDDLVSGIPVIGELADALATIALLIGVLVVLRWLSRRFLFNVSRRLGLAFLFVGVFPLLWFVLFVLGIGATVVVHLASHDSHATLEEIVAETAVVAERAQRAARGAPSPTAFRPGWQRLAGVAGASTETRALIWVGAASEEPGEVRVGDSETGRPAPAPEGFGAFGAPPAWSRAATSFSGLVAFPDTIRITALRPGELGDGRPFLTMVVEPLGDRVAERVHERTGIVATRVDAEALIRRSHEAVVDTLPTTLDGDADDDGDGTSLSMSISHDGATSMLTARVVDWQSGELIDLGDAETFQIVPIYSLEFGLRDYLRTHFGETGQGGMMWLLTKVLGITSLAMMVLATIIGVVLTVSVTRAVNALHRGTKRVAAGDLDHRIEVKSKDQLGALAASFNDMTTSVKRLLDEKKEKDRLVHEMEIAAEVQNTMLPRRFPTIPGLDGAARCMMAKEVGGDFYDFVPISPTRIGLAIGDVSGKGVSAALVMSNVMSSLRSLLKSDPLRGPADLLVQLNEILYNATAPDRFVTLFYAEYDLTSASLRYANAGHDWPMVVSPEGQLVLDLESSGLMLGALPRIQLTEREITLEPGDVVVAYSDGLVDTVNEEDEPFERERAQAVIAGHIEETPERVVEALAGALNEWQGGAEDVDDVTLIVLKRVALPGAQEDAVLDVETVSAG